jgi:hypothetical protein
MQKDKPIDKDPQMAAVAKATERPLVSDKAFTPEPQRAPAERNVDTELRLDGEADTLYDDDLEVDKSAGELAGVRGNTPGIAKP